MASITISDLRPAGFDLLSDSESFMEELSSEELGLQGGLISSPACGVAVSVAVVVSYQYTKKQGWW
jgi:hypothetical protein